MPGKNHEIAQAILDLIKSEADARILQDRLIALLDDKQDIDKVRETSSDEANHSLIYEAMLKKYNGGISASADGAILAIKEITVGIKSDG